MLKVNDLGFRRGSRPILANTTFHLPEGGRLALLGPSGCGKTTLLRLIAGFERAHEGEILLRDQVISSSKVHRSAFERRVGFVFQNYALFPHLSVYDNVTFGVPQLHKDVHASAEELMKVFGISHLRGKKPHEISGGEQQRVAVVRALVPGPELLLLDEPLAHLDSDLRLRMIRELKERLSQLGVTSLLVTHSQKEAFEFCDHLLVMAGPGVFQMGPPHQVYSRPANRVLAEMTGEGSVFLSRRTATGSYENLWGQHKPDAHAPEIDFFVRPENVMVGSGPEALVRRCTYRGGEVLVELEACKTGEQILMSRRPYEEALKVGQKVHLTLRPGAQGAWLN